MPKKILVAYYSLEGNTRFIAETMSEALDADLLEIRPKKSIPEKGFLKYFWGGKQVFFKECPELEPWETDLAQYEQVIIGTPVWNSGITPPVRSWLKQAGISAKEIHAFCCYSGKAGHTFSDIAGLTPDSRIVSTREFADPLAHDEKAAQTQCRDWAQNILGGAN